MKQRTFISRSTTMTTINFLFHWTSVWGKKFKTTSSENWKQVCINDFNKGSIKVYWKLVVEELTKNVAMKWKFFINSRFSTSLSISSTTSFEALLSTNILLPCFWQFEMSRIFFLMLVVLLVTAGDAHRQTDRKY